MMHRLLMVLLVVGLIAGQAGIGTTACFTDTELNADNTFQAWVSSQWVQTTQGDFQAGVLDNVDTSSSPGDVQLAQQITQTVIAWDDFESGGWDGGAGWLWGWWNAGASSVTTSGGPHGGSYHLELSRSNGYVDRALDLSGRSNVHLQFWAKADSFEAHDFAECYIYDGIVWDTVKTWVDGEDDNIYHFYDIDLSGYNMYNQFYICFDADMGNNDFLYIDDLELVVPATAYYSSGTIASQVLDTGIAGAKWDALFWVETLPANTDITFEVRASDTAFTKDAATPSWTFVGGTSPITSGLPSGRYLQWRATLTTSDTSNTPTLHEVTIDYY